MILCNLPVPSSPLPGGAVAALISFSSSSSSSQQDGGGEGRRRRLLVCWQSPGSHSPPPHHLHPDHSRVPHQQAAARVTRHSGHNPSRSGGYGWVTSGQPSTSNKSITHRCKRVHSSRLLLAESGIVFFLATLLLSPAHLDDGTVLLQPP